MQRDEKEANEKDDEALEFSRINFRQAGDAEDDTELIDTYG